MARPRSTPPAEPVLTSEARSTLNLILDEELPEDEMRQIIRALRDKAKDGDLPAARVLEKFMSQGKGTPKQTVSPEMNAKIAAAKTIADLEALSDDELAAIVAAE